MITPTPPSTFFFLPSRFLFEADSAAVHSSASLGGQRWNGWGTGGWGGGQFYTLESNDLCPPLGPPPAKKRKQKAASLMNVNRGSSRRKGGGGLKIGGA
jgi:hypothetical protein